MPFWCLTDQLGFSAISPPSFMQLPDKHQRVNAPLSNNSHICTGALAIFINTHMQAFTYIMLYVLVQIIYTRAIAG